MAVADKSSIEELIKSSITAYQIEKDTGVSRTTISRIRTGKASIENLSFENAAKLTDYFKGKGKIR